MHVHAMRLSGVLARWQYKNHVFVDCASVLRFCAQHATRTHTLLLWFIPDPLHLYFFSLFGSSSLCRGGCTYCRCGCSLLRFEHAPAADFRRHPSGRLAAALFGMSVLASMRMAVDCLSFVLHNGDTSRRGGYLHLLLLFSVVLSVSEAL